MNKINICGEDIQIDVEHLYLDNNQLTSLPTEIGNLVNLKCLYLYNNKLTSLPTEIGNLEKLERLGLRNNHIPKEEIEKLKELLPNCKIYNDYE